MYDVGDTYPATVKVYDATGTLTDAASITFTFTLPDGTTTSPAPTHPSTGVYQYDFPITQPGLHRFRAVSTTPATAYADAFNAADSAWPAYIGLAEVKDHLNIPATNTTYDDELRGFILSACEVVESITGPVTRRTVVETYSGGRPSIALDNYPVLSITSVTEYGRALASTSYSLANGVLTRVAGNYWAYPWMPGTNNIVVTYVVGRTSVPWSVVDGTKELIRINWRPQTGGNYSVFDQGRADDYNQSGRGGEVRLGFFIPNTVMERLQPSALGPLVA